MPAMHEETAMERLPPIQYLMLKLLAIRYANGETYVILPSSTVGAAKGLEFQSLVTWEGVTNGIAVSLTPAGIKTAESFGF